MATRVPSLPCPGRVSEVGLHMSDRLLSIHHDCAFSILFCQGTMTDPSSITGTDTSYGKPNFRADLLYLADIHFDSANADLPTSAAQLVASLAYWPFPQDPLGEDPEFDAAPATVVVATEEDVKELKAAGNLARRVTTTKIQEYTLQAESKWVSQINLRLLKPLVDAEEAHLLTFQQDASWDRGLRVLSLSNPKPDVVFGLHTSTESGSPLHPEFLNSLRVGSGIRLLHSPVDGLQLVYPSVIHEAKANLGSLFFAENQLAVTAAIALALLDDLSTMSGVPFQHCVILLASQGPLWSIHLAYQDTDVKKSIVSFVFENCLSTRLTPRPCSTLFG